jgi:hypothetical protein
MSEFKLDLSDLEVESIAAETTENGDLSAVKTGDIGHGMAEIGASCCCEAAGNGSCCCEDDPAPIIVS